MHQEADRGTISLSFGCALLWPLDQNLDRLGARQTPPAQTYLEFARPSRSKAELQAARHRLVRGIATCRKRYVALRLDWVVREHRPKWRNRRFAGADRRRVWI